MTTKRNNSSRDREHELHWWILVHSYDVNGPIAQGKHFWSDITGAWVKSKRDATLYKDRPDALLQSGKLAQRNILTRIVRVDRVETPVTFNTVVLDHTRVSQDPTPMTVINSSEGQVIMSYNTDAGPSTVTMKFDNYVQWIRDGDLQVVWDPDRKEVPESADDYFVSIGVYKD